MSVTIDTSFVNQFSDTVHTLLRQRGSKLMGLFPTVQAVGEMMSFDRIGSLEVTEATNRHDVVASSRFRKMINISNDNKLNLVIDNNIK